MEEIKSVVCFKVKKDLNSDFWLRVSFNKGKAVERVRKYTEIEELLTCITRQFDISKELMPEFQPQAWFQHSSSLFNRCEKKEVDNVFKHLFLLPPSTTTHPLFLAFFKHDTLHSFKLMYSSILKEINTKKLTNENVDSYSCLQLNGNPNGTTTTTSLPTSYNDVIINDNDSKHIANTNLYGELAAGVDDDDKNNNVDDNNVEEDTGVYYNEINRNQDNKINNTTNNNDDSSNINNNTPFKNNNNDESFYYVLENCKAEYSEIILNNNNKTKSTIGLNDKHNNTSNINIDDNNAKTESNNENNENDECCDPTYSEYNNSPEEEVLYSQVISKKDKRNTKITENNKNIESNLNTNESTNETPDTDNKNNEVEDDKKEKEEEEDEYDDIGDGNDVGYYNGNFEKTSVFRYKVLKNVNYAGKISIFEIGEIVESSLRDSVKNCVYCKIINKTPNTKRKLNKISKNKNKTSKNNKTENENSIKMKTSEWVSEKYLEPVEEVSRNGSKKNPKPLPCIPSLSSKPPFIPHHTFSKYNPSCTSAPTRFSSPTSPSTTTNTHIKLSHTKSLLPVTNSTCVSNTSDKVNISSVSAGVVKKEFEAELNKSILTRRSRKVTSNHSFENELEKNLKQTTTTSITNDNSNKVERFPSETKDNKIGDNDPDARNDQFIMDVENNYAEIDENFATRNKDKEIKYIEGSTLECKEDKNEKKDENDDDDGDDSKKGGFWLFRFKKKNKNSDKDKKLNTGNNDCKNSSRNNSKNNSNNEIKNNNNNDTKNNSNNDTKDTSTSIRNDNRNSIRHNSENRKTDSNLTNPSSIQRIGSLENNNSDKNRSCDPKVNSSLSSLKGKLSRTPTLETTDEEADVVANVYDTTAHDTDVYDTTAYDTTSYDTDVYDTTVSLDTPASDYDEIGSRATNASSESTLCVYDDICSKGREKPVPAIRFNSEKSNNKKYDMNLSKYKIKNKNKCHDEGEKNITKIENQNENNDKVCDMFSRKPSKKQNLKNTKKEFNLNDVMVMERKLCEDKLTDSRIYGGYVFRRSEKKNDLVLSVLASTNQVHHFPIAMTTDLKLEFGEYRFKDLKEIVEYYSSNSLMGSAHLILNQMIS